MGREKYRNTIRVLRRRLDEQGRPVTSGGYGGDEYAELFVTAAGVRDESDVEYSAAESARIEHIKTFAMRTRDIREDDLIVWHGDSYKVRRIDAFDHRGREIRVKAAVFKSRYTVSRDG